MTVRPIIEIRIGELRYNQIGHIIYESECYPEIIRKKSMTVFFSLKKPVANEFLASKYRHSFTILPKFQSVLEKMKSLPGSSRTLFGHPMNDVMDLGDCSLPRSRGKKILNDTENSEAELLLRSFDLESGKYVCFHSRDPAYYQKCKPHGDVVKSEWFDFRDSDIMTYLLAINRLQADGLKAVRMGLVVRDVLGVNGRNIIDYPYSEFQSDRNDIYLCANCKFFIGTQSGLTMIPILFNRPVLWVNSFWRGASFNNSGRDIFIFKKLWLRDQNRFLTFKEMRELGAPQGNTGEAYSKLGLEIINNTEEEILEAAEEMNGRLDGTWTAHDEDEALQDKYRQFLWKDYLKPTDQLPRLGAAFLRQNRELLTERNSAGRVYSIAPLNSFFKNTSHYIPGNRIDFNRGGNWSRFRGIGWKSKDQCAVMKWQGSHLKLCINSINETARLTLVFSLVPALISFFSDNRVQLVVKANDTQMTISSLEIAGIETGKITMVIPKEAMNGWRELHLNFLFLTATRQTKWLSRIFAPIGPLALYHMQIDLDNSVSQNHPSRDDFSADMSVL